MKKVVITTNARNICQISHLNKQDTPFSAAIRLKCGEGMRQYSSINFFTSVTTFSDWNYMFVKPIDAPHFNEGSSNFKKSDIFI